MPIAIIATSSTGAGTAAFVAANTLTIITAGTTLTSTGAIAVQNLATSDNCELRVDGSVFGDIAAVSLQSNGVTDVHSLIVGQSGILQSVNSAAIIAGQFGMLTNLGQMNSIFSNAVLMTGASAQVTNMGTITSERGSGVSMTGAFAVLQNYGTVVAMSGNGIFFNNASGAIIDNHGTISGRVSSITCGTGNDRVTNSGNLIGVVGLNAGNDQFIGTGGLAALVVAGAGDDSLRGGGFDDTFQGDIGNDVLAGRDGADTLNGGSNDDRLIGGAEDDLLIGGSGLDVMSGGAGADVFKFSFLSDIGKAIQSDRITDFASGIDSIDLADIGGLSFIGAAAFGLVAGQVRYVKAAGHLQIDQTGDGVADFFLQLTPGAAFAAGDLIL